MSDRTRITLGSVIAIFFFTVGWFFNATMANSNEDIYVKIDRGLSHLRDVFETISRNYVDEIDPETLSKAAINGMLRDFDPYTVFFQDPGSQQMRMITRGKYGGVGMEISVQDDKIVVITPMDSSPAQRAGIRAGDIILTIDGRATNRLHLEEASQQLRGKVGTEVQIEIHRPGLSNSFHMTLIREEITLEDVTYAGFIEPGTAYFRLSAFSEKASAEMKNAIRQLQLDMPIERVILDLRSNPGGLLTAAVDIVNLFLPPGQLVVSTRGIHENENKFYTNSAPMLPTQPLVILVNESSASAAEIVAGAIQDWDRGVLIGQPTFGKGLVQKVYPIDRINQAYLKITTAKYYVPSGRSIQKEDYKKGSRVFIDHSDSLEYNQELDYYTQNHRVVHGGGGIQPDMRIERQSDNRFLQTLLARGFFFQFAVDYLSTYTLYKDAQYIRVDDQVLNDFKDYVNNHNFSFEMDGEKQLDDFLTIAHQFHYEEDLKDLVGVALQKLQKGKDNQFELYENQIQKLLVAEFAEKAGGLKSRIEASMPFDPQLQSALQVMRSGETYKGILAIR